MSTGRRQNRARICFFSTYPTHPLSSFLRYPAARRPAALPAPAFPTFRVGSCHTGDGQTAAGLGGQTDDLQTAVLQSRVDLVLARAALRRAGLEHRLRHRLAGVRVGLAAVEAFDRVERPGIHHDHAERARLAEARGQIRERVRIHRPGTGQRGRFGRPGCVRDGATHAGVIGRPGTRVERQIVSPGRQRAARKPVSSSPAKRAAGMAFLAAR